MQVALYNPYMGIEADDEFVTLPFGQALKYLRIQARLKQDQLAEMLGVGQSTVSGWERMISPPARDPVALDKLAEILGVSLLDLQDGRVRRTVAESGAIRAGPVGESREEMVRILARFYGGASYDPREFANWLALYKATTRERRRPIFDLLGFNADRAEDDAEGDTEQRA